ncbi:alpha-galactosidase [Cryobacterium lactosi]|uniref:alpha-galactosidase n=1 Tax=Cryobacterium lactosi TaxID=1259202 RepID=A0A4R9BGK0_9MICO|nr:alpha-galactosidase [Cryobacterium lactosi]TFD84006.1 alpha-galactosidase [Cryobacterium lactosi]
MVPHAEIDTISPAPQPDRILHLRRGGTSVVIDLDSPYGPAIVHWGAALTVTTADTLRHLALAVQPQRVTGGLDHTPRVAVVPTASSGWPGTPGVEGHRADGTDFSLLLTLSEVDVTPTAATLTLTDPETGLLVVAVLSLGSAGVFTQQLTVTNTGDTAYTVDRLQATFPIPIDAAEILDTTGRHLRERTPQRHAFTYGSHVRESRRGRPGADSTLLFTAGQPGFGFETGLVHGIHVAWSGNHRVAGEKVTTGEAFLTGGELYLPGEITLLPGESVQSPRVMGSWGVGLDELAHRIRTEWRARPHHPQRPRPVTLNTWEAVYFDHDLPRLKSLADIAAEVGVERFVLDDGWYHGRRDDTAGLGDWHVDETVWPNGLAPIIDHVIGLGMEFGLWVEPEMVNPDSDLARTHPEWLLRARTTEPMSGRNQQVVNLADPEAYAHIAERLHTLLDEYRIAYLKWDHNRDLVDPGAGAGGQARAHAHTQAFYRLLDELRAAHPGLEIESCASGGARVDLGVLDRTDRIWASDNLDPIERLRNQRYTSLIVPPEMMGTHVSSPTVHTTGRVVDLAFSAAAALFGHFGIEWDLTTTDAKTRAELAEWVQFAKQIRPLVAHGRLVNVDLADPSLDVRGMVSDDGDTAVFTIAQTEMSATYPTGRIRLPGLRPDLLFRVTPILLADAHGSGLSPLRWLENGAVLTGAELGTVGVRPPTMKPQQAVVLQLTAIGR